MNAIRTRIRMLPLFLHKIAILVFVYTHKSDRQKFISLFLSNEVNEAAVSLLLNSYDII